jgi:amino acid transporter
MTTATLKAGAISLFESVIMGVAGSAPGFSIATTAAVLLASAGTVSVNALFIFAVPMLGIAITYKGLNKRMPRAGAAYDWTTESFGKFLGFLSGWALLIATLVFIVSGSLTLGSNLMNIVYPAASNSLLATTALGAVCYLGIGVVLIAGIGLTSKVQVVMTCVELAILAVVAGACGHGRPGAVPGLGLAGFWLFALQLCGDRAGGGVFLLGLGCHLQPWRGDDRPSAECGRQWRVLQRVRDHRDLRCLHRGGDGAVHHEGRPEL